MKTEMKFAIETEKEADCRWIAEAMEVNGVMVYGETRINAVDKVKTLALRVVADSIQHDDGPTGAFSVVVKVKREADGQWRAEFQGIPESTASGITRAEAKIATKTRALQVVAKQLARMEKSKAPADFLLELTSVV